MDKQDKTEHVDQTKTKSLKITLVFLNAGNAIIDERLIVEDNNLEEILFNIHDEYFNYIRSFINLRLIDAILENGIINLIYVSVTDRNNNKGEWNERGKFDKKYQDIIQECSFFI